MASSGNDWYKKSASDMDMVRRALDGNPVMNLEGAAYHVQQAAEKLLKGYLTDLGIRYPFTHDIGTLAHLIPSTDPLRPDAIALDATSSWATQWRYPADDPATNPVPDLADIEIWRQKVEDLTGLMHPAPSSTAQP